MRKNTIFYLCWYLITLALLVATPLILTDWHAYQGGHHFFHAEHDSTWFKAFLHWDCEHYIFLALFGYDGPNIVKSFYPLLPWLIRLVRFFITNPLVSGILVTGCLGLGFSRYYYAYLSKNFDARVALRALILSMSFPTFFYVAVLYTEGLFLFLFFGFLYYYQRKSWFSLPFAFMLPFSRGQGFFVPVAIGTALLTTSSFWKKKNEWPFQLSVLLSFGGGGAAFFLFFWLVYNNPFLIIESQRQWVFGNSLANIFNLTSTFENFMRPPSNFFAFVNSGFDRIFMIFALVCLPAMFFFKDRLISCLFFVLLYVPLTMGLGGSYARFSLLWFVFLSPYLVLKIKNTKLFIFLVLASFTVQTYLIFRFALGYWVA